MALTRVRQLLDRLSVKAIFNRLDKRKLQNELDTHRLFLVTSHHDRLLTGKTIGQNYVQDLAAEAEHLGHEGMRSVVAASLQQQFVSTSTMLHNILSQASDPMLAAKRAILADTQQKQHADFAAAPNMRRPRGLAAAMGAADFRSNLPSSTSSSTAASTSSSSSSSGSSDDASEVVTSFYNDSSPSDEVSSSAGDASSSSNDNCAGAGHSGRDSGNYRNVVSSSSSLPSSNSSSSGSSSSSSSSSSNNSSNSSDSARLEPRTSGTGLSMAELSAALQKQLGFSLDVRRSGISHPDAGDGLWLQGRAPVGALVALYPGLVYEPMHYRKIPGYPRIDAKNDYFLARFDGALIDGQSWGRGRTTSSSSIPIDMNPHSSYLAMLEQLHQKEMRHPLALAHFANHPAAGTQPNVMVAAFDFAPDGEPRLPAYMPNIMFEDLKAETSKDIEQSKVVKGLALVAVQPIHDEEIYLNYRLNPQVQKPSWYAAVDADEDKRRWY